MAKKSRKRRRRPGAAAPARPAPTVPPREPTRRRTARDEPPQAPWGSFPMVELTVLVALVMLVLGFVIGGTRGVVMIGVGVVLGSLAGLELSIREHLAGYRSHSLILAGMPAVLAITGLFLFAPGLAPTLQLAIGAGVFLFFLWLFTRVFKRRSGGVVFKIRGFGG